MPLRRTTVALTALALATALVGCSSAGTSAKGTSAKGTSSESTAAGSSSSATADSASSEPVVIGQPNEPRSLEAGFSTSQSETNVAEQVNEKLIEFTPDGKGFDPRLATKWEITAPGTLRVTLREGVTFTNGETFTSSTVLFSAEKMKENHDYDDYTRVLEGYKAVDDHTVDVTFTGTDGQALAGLALASFQYPEKYYAEVGKEKFGTAPIGTGPFIFDKWEKGVSVSFTANPHYWGGVPAAPKLTFQFFADPTAGLNALQGGTVHLLTQPSIGAVPVLKGTEGLKLVANPGGRTYSIHYSRFSKTPITDQKVRLALQHAVDTEALIKNQRSGLARSASGQYTPDFATGFNPDVKQPVYDPALAKKMLADAGYPNGFKINFAYASRDAEVAQAIAAQLEAAGMQVTQEPLEAGTYLTKMGPPQELNDIWLGGALTPPDAQYILTSYTCDFWYGYHCDKAFDAELGKIQATTDGSIRVDLMKQAAVILADNPPGIPLYVTDDLYGTSTNLEGFEPYTTQYIDARKLSVTG